MNRREQYPAKIETDILHEPAIQFTTDIHQRLGDNATRLHLRQNSALQKLPNSGHSDHAGHPALAQPSIYAFAGKLI